MTDVGPILRSLRRHKGPAALLTMEVAMGMAVLVHLFAMGSYYYEVAFASSGMDEPNLIAVTRTFVGPSQPEAGARAQAVADQARLSTIDGVVAAAVLDEIPLPRMEAFSTVLRTSEGGPGQRTAVAWPLRASSDVVAALGLRQVDGVDFSGAVQGATGERRALVTVELARHLFPAGGAVGGLIEGEGLPRARIIGVVADFRIRMPFHPDNLSVVVVEDLPVSAHRMVYVVRSAPGRREAVVAELRKTFGRTASASGGDTIQIPYFDNNLRFRIISRGATVVVCWTAAVVLAVALFGSLALASFSVAERTRQIGVRRALGARRGQIVSYFLTENAIVTSIGLGIGLALAAVVNLPIRAMMPSMAITWRQIALAMIVIWSTGLLSALVPARRAARIPPTAATRSL